MNYEEMLKQITEMLPVKKEIDEKENLINLGLTSIKIMKFVSALRKEGIKISYGKLMEEPTLEAWKNLIETVAVKKNKVRDVKKVMLDEPFELTDVQYAYKVGRDDGQELGGVGCHAFIEFEGKDIDIERLDKAWKTVQYHHPMLRACFPDDGTQKILDKPFNEHIDIVDLSKEKNWEKKAADVEERLSHRRFEVEKGHVAAFTLIQLPDNHYRLIYDIDLLVADVQSFNVVLRDVATAYKGRELPEDSRNWSFGQYLETKRNEEAEDAKKGKEYWSKRIEDIALAPELPLQKDPSEIGKMHTSRSMIKIPMVIWNRVLKAISDHNTTPAIYLMAVYAEIIASRSSSKKFIINIPMFDRHFEYGANENAVADFTTLLLLEIDMSDDPSFEELVARIQERLHEDMKHSAYSGVKVQRDIVSKLGETKSIAPVVFACNFGNPIMGGEIKEVMGDFRSMISQTPGVWIDFQSYENDEEVMLTWDTVDGLFPDGLIDGMMESMENLITDTSIKDWKESFDLLPKNQRDFIEEQKNITLPEKTERLFDGFLRSVHKYPDKTAVIDTGAGISFTYRELYEKAMSVAGYMNKKGVYQKSIAVTVTRGYRQAVAVLGILLSGNSYVPVSINQPKERRKLIHEKTDIFYAITDEIHVKEIEWPKSSEVFVIEELMNEDTLKELPSVSPKYPAYIIMTSGTTGLPKGAQMFHQGPSATINDVNKKYGITENDIVLGVSSIDFDLSVYDLFGSFTAGATLVMIPDDKSRDSEYWLEMVEKYGVTVWNSVPILFNMLMTTAEMNEHKLPIRVIMLSGDWIGLDLPERAEKLTDNARFISMGGATEASIWSNFFEVKTPLPSGWKSIPYGRPLSGQSFRIVDVFGRDVPFLCEGELLIGGIGVGTYKGDDELNAKKFVDEYGSVWYRTGDYGRFWNDGTIEFLGRKDFQVKIRGHRIELGEAETVLKNIEGVKNAAVEVADNGEKHLVAYLEKRSADTGEHIREPLLKKDEKGAYESSKIIERIFSEKTYTSDNVEAFLEAKTDEVLFELLSKTETLNGENDNSYSQVIDGYKEYLCERGIIEKQDECFRVLKTPEKAEVGNIYEEKLGEVIDRLSTYLPKIIKEEADATDIYYASGNGFSPNDFVNLMPGSGEVTEYVASIIQNIASVKGRCIRVLEVEARNLGFTERVLEKIEGQNVCYVAADSSGFFLGQMGALNDRYECFETSLLNDDIYEGEKFDLVIAFNYLHRCDDDRAEIKKIREALISSGVLCIAEVTENSALQYITADVLSKRIIDLPGEQHYMELLEGEGFDSVAEVKIGTESIFIALSEDKLYVPDKDYIVSVIEDKLPEYMIPKVYYVVDKLPLSSNGKIDRKKLRKMADSTAQDTVKSEPVTETEKKLCEIWKELFGRTVGINDNYYRLGGDSLTAIKMISKVREVFGVEYSMKDALSDVTIIAQSEKIDKKLSVGETAERFEFEQITHDRENENEPFPLTEVQNAYFLGRNGSFNLGEVSTHCYFELDGESLDVEKAGKALNDMIQTHGAMRLVIDDNGTQRILKKVPEYEIKTYRPAADKVDAVLAKVRDEMSHQVIDIAKWPLFDIRAAIYEDKFRIFVSFDNIVFDGFSMFGVLDEWAQRYRGEYKNINPPEITFRDYVTELNKIKISGKYEEDKKYWIDRLEDFLPAPELPLSKTESEVKNQKFKRNYAELSAERWNKLLDTARLYEITPSVLLMAAYTEVIRSRSANSEFTLNLTQFDRKPVHKDVNRIYGDFTTLTLLEIKNSEEISFVERAKKIGYQLREDMEHSYYSAVDFEREIRHQTDNLKNSVMPVVFTSGIGVTKQEDKWIGDLTYNVSQTPQVWLDHQVVERNGKLCLSWDSLEEIFYPDFIDRMFEDYIQLLEKLADDKSLFTAKAHSLIDIRLSEERIAANNTEKDLPDKSLDDLFYDAAERFSDNIAVVGKDVRLTYKELKEKALGLAGKLKIKSGDKVGILMPKCPEQVVAALGILTAGGAYLPLDINNPDDRIKTIIRDSGTEKIIYKDVDADRISSLSDYETINIDDVESTDDESVRVINNTDKLAYVIYTSGSTGMPKGVMISHKGAVNTIEDINARFDISSSDACLAISNMHFDLSVYDVFGLLAAGGKIVIPDADKVKDPGHWAELLDKENITVWNSVPAFAEMLYEGRDKLKNNSLRLMLLSGDWISTSLPERIREIYADIRFVSLGGATEASIWSNIYEVEESVPKDWKSIPYGKPLSNQRYYILDDHLKNRPDWTPGHIFIGGKGVALGYLNDKEKTSAKFITNPDTGEYMYDTGDMGRYWSDGNIEFLGRNDNQIKINGYRVEIGEVESKLNSVDKVSDGKVIFRNGLLIAFFRYEGVFDDNEQELLKNELYKMLPAYMVPRKLVRLEAYPLTPNGKIDNKKLFELSQDVCTIGERTNGKALTTETEQKLADVWSKVLGYSPVYADDDFFMLGGDSLKAIYLVNGIKKSLAKDISVKAVFTSTVLSNLAVVIEQEESSTLSGSQNEEEFSI